MKIIQDISELRKQIAALPRPSTRLGLVPTMGALHEGHLSLVDHSTEQCNFTAVSIFVNPTQFAAGEDLDKYPRTLEEDCDMLRQRNVDLVFVPDKQLMYPPGFSTMVEPPDVAKVLEGEHRPEHFKGVTTIVLKLLNLVQPDVAFFGQKDYQQALVIQTMVADLNVNVEIETCQIVRESSGLAMSSRNRYLDPSQRQMADSIYQALDHAQQLVQQGEIDGRAVSAEMVQFLIDHGIDQIDYALLADPQTLQPLDQVTLPAIALIAAYVGKTRLIDNRIFA